MQGWMQKLWAIKTGKPETKMNGEDMELTAEDLKILKSVVEGGNLPVTQGFFYGPDSSQDDWRKEKDLDFIKVASEAIDGGQKVFYSCWY